jgi:hypothetical protein
LFLPEAHDRHGPPRIPASGLRADFSCSGARELPFSQGSAPAARAPCASEIGVAVEQVKEKAKGWLERLFGR